MNYQKVKHPPFDTQMLCAEIDPFIFFPEKNKTDKNTSTAKRICMRCPSQHQCLTYALHYKVHGIWGGYTTSERARMRKQRGIAGIPLAYDEWSVAVEQG